MPKQRTATPSSIEGVAIRPVTAETWPGFAKLFESPGAPKNCWCMAWRATTEERKAFSAVAGDKAASGRAKTSELRRAAIHGRINANTPVGLLAYADGEPIAWCSIAPRPSYRSLGGPKDFTEAPEKVWSIACFFVTRPWRGKGLVRRLIETAVAYARANGASIVEAYPVAPDAPSYRFMGLVPVFASAGFEAVGTAGSRRTVMRRAV